MLLMFPNVPMVQFARSSWSARLDPLTEDNRVSMIRVTAFVTEGTGLTSEWRVYGVKVKIVSVHSVNEARHWWWKKTQEQTAGPVSGCF
ncbi:hypothetical protein BaRGS_00026059 [Batillaria attramentaria]|uniref:Uncharacterized protein n=1 Tax=Batillaria attramentaria TaxID=370345 RepID=A0ABD0K6S2_9CAEN